MYDSCEAPTVSGLPGDSTSKSLPEPGSTLLKEVTCFLCNAWLLAALAILVCGTLLGGWKDKHEPLLSLTLDLPRYT